MKKFYESKHQELDFESQLRTAKVRLRAGFAAMRRHPVRIAASIFYFALLLLFLREYPVLLGLEPLIAKLTAPFIWRASILSPPIRCAIRPSWCTATLSACWTRKCR